MSGFVRATVGSDVVCYKWGMKLNTRTLRECVCQKRNAQGIHATGGVETIQGRQRLTEVLNAAVQIQEVGLGS